jgi:hypothetical protein
MSLFMRFLIIKLNTHLKYILSKTIDWNFCRPISIYYKGLTTRNLRILYHILNSSIDKDRLEK